MRLKLHIARCLLSCMAALASLAASAYDFELNGIYYNIRKTRPASAEVTYDGTSVDCNDSNPKRYTGDIDIPSNVTYNGINYPVTRIGDRAFYNCDELTSINIPTSVEGLGSFAFYGCKKLSTIKLQEGLKYINPNAFEYCENLKTINLPSTLSSLSIVSLSNSGLETIVIPEGITTLAEQTLSKCKNLKHVTLPKSLTEIGDGVFYECTSLETIEIPASVTLFGSYVFDDCSNLRMITLYSIEPPTAVELHESTYSPPGTFNSWHYANTGLNVPMESIEKYKTAPVWENFFKEQDNPLTGIEDVEAEGGKEIEGRYDLSGRPVAEDYRGVVIVRYADGTTSKEVRR